MSTLASPATTGSSQPPAAIGRTAGDDPLLGMLFPVWQFAIGCCVVAVTVAALYRLARRGRSRMGTALLVTGAAVVALALVGSLFGGH